MGTEPQRGPSAPAQCEWVWCLWLRATVLPISRVLSSDPSSWSRWVGTEYSLLGAVQTGSPLHLSPQYLRGHPGHGSCPSVGEPGGPARNLWLQGMGREERRKGKVLLRTFPFPFSLNPRTLGGQGPIVSGNGAALFEMFSYLIPCPGKGPSLTLRVAPSFPCLPFCPDRTPQVLICCLPPSLIPMCFSSSLAFPS